MKILWAGPLYKYLPCLALSLNIDTHNATMMHQVASSIMAFSYTLATAYPWTDCNQYTMYNTTGSVVDTQDVHIYTVFSLTLYQPVRREEAVAGGAAEVINTPRLVQHRHL